MAELIASGTTEADSADFTLAAGDQATLFLKDAAGTTVNVAACRRAGSHQKRGWRVLHGREAGHSSEPAKVLPRLAPTASRLAAAVAYGVDKV
jgi:esterase/lipase